MVSVAVSKQIKPERRLSYTTMQLSRRSHLTNIEILLPENLLNLS